MPWNVEAKDLPQHKAFRSSRTSDSQGGVLRRNGDDVRALDLFHGPGGKERRPAGRFTFVKEYSGGSCPKFEIVDERGVHWIAKLGEETKSETAATRLAWAAGYFAGEDYYLPELRVSKLQRLRRGRKFVSADGIVHGARLERIVDGRQKGESWSWFENPHLGTKQFDGLRVMMSLTNNWDLKKSNNGIYQHPGAEPSYEVSDLGATFGRTGNVFTRSKSNVQDYSRSQFVQKVTPEYVDFHLSSRPFFLTIFAVPNYVKRTKMQAVAKDIPRTHARWIGQILGQLSPGQIRDCFRAAGYSPEEVEGFTLVVQQRIADLKRL